MTRAELADEIAVIACWSSDEAWLQSSMCPASAEAQAWWEIFSPGKRHLLQRAALRARRDKLAARQQAPR